MKNGNGHDPLLDHAAVKLCRDYTHLTPNHIQRKDIAVTVKDDAKHLSIWEGVLHDYMLTGKNPCNKGYMLDLYQEKCQKMRVEL